MANAQSPFMVSWRPGMALGPLGLAIEGVGDCGHGMDERACARETCRPRADVVACRCGHRVLGAAARAGGNIRDGQHRVGEPRPAGGRTAQHRRCAESDEVEGAGRGFDHRHDRRCRRSEPGRRDRGRCRDQELRARQRHGARHEIRNDDHVLLDRAGQCLRDDGRRVRAGGLQSDREQLEQRHHPDALRSSGAPGDRRLRGRGRERQRRRLWWPATTASASAASASATATTTTASASSTASASATATATTTAAATASASASAYRLRLLRLRLRLHHHRLRLHLRLRLRLRHLRLRLRLRLRHRLQRRRLRGRRRSGVRRA